MSTFISRRGLNRATLERQLLLRRSDLTALEAVEQLAGLNGQDAPQPYLMLWARLNNFRHEDLTELLYDHRVVRGSMMRNTQHLMSARDYLAWRPVLQPALDRSRQGFHGKGTRGLDLVELAEVGRTLLQGRELTRPQLGRMLADRWPEHDPGAMAWSVQALVAVVHPPPSGTWGRKGGATPFTLAEPWIGGELVTDLAPDAMIKRYLAAFGPATVKDIQAFSGLTRLAEVVERLAPQLRVFRGEDGQQLYDLPDAPRPDPQTPAPARLLPRVDNLLISYADRTRVMSDEHRKQVCVGPVVEATAHVDGMVCGMWRIDREPGRAVLVVELFDPLLGEGKAALEAEALRMLSFAAADADSHDVRFTLR